MKIRSEMNPSNTFESLADDLSETCLMHEFIPTNACELKEIIAESGIKCSPSDLLPSTLLKQNFDLLLPLFVDLVNKSLQSGNVDGVKEADIIPLLKGDGMDPNILKNFRPVSNLLFLGKLIERVVLRRINTHIICPATIYIFLNNLHISAIIALRLSWLGLLTTFL